MNMLLDKQSIYGIYRVYVQYVQVYVFVVYRCTCYYSYSDFQLSLPLCVT